MSLKLNKLETLRINMRKDNRVALEFSYKNGKGDFSIVFYDLEPMVLTFVKKKSNPIKYLSLEVADNFSIKTNLENDNYKLLIELLELEFKKGEPFKPFNFFIDFSRNIPDYVNTKNIDVKKSLKYCSSYVEDELKTICIGFKNNQKNHHVSVGNLNKTKIYFGQKEYERCKEGNISSVWTVPKKD